MLFGVYMADLGGGGGVQGLENSDFACDLFFKVHI